MVPSAYYYIHWATGSACIVPGSAFRGRATHGLNGLEKIELDHKSQWLEVLADVLGEPLLSYSHQERDELWKRAFAAHTEWKKSIISL
ncbi:hypothetical protein [Paenibacillus sp. NPDC055715]